jgi:hypothetical protein
MCGTRDRSNQKGTRCYYYYCLDIFEISLLASILLRYFSGVIPWLFNNPNCSSVAICRLTFCSSMGSLSNISWYALLDNLSASLLLSRGIHSILISLNFDKRDFAFWYSGIIFTALTLYLPFSWLMTSWESPLAMIF